MSLGELDKDFLQELEEEALATAKTAPLPVGELAIFRRKISRQRFTVFKTPLYYLFLQGLPSTQDAAGPPLPLSNLHFLAKKLPREEPWKAPLKSQAVRGRSSLLEIPVLHVSSFDLAWDNWVQQLRRLEVVKGRQALLRVIQQQPDVLKKPVMQESWQAGWKQWEDYLVENWFLAEALLFQQKHGAAEDAELEDLQAALDSLLVDEED